MLPSERGHSCPQQASKADPFEPLPKPYMPSDAAADRNVRAPPAPFPPCAPLARHSFRAKAAVELCQNEGCTQVPKNYARENQRKEYLWLKKHNHALLGRTNYQN